MIACILCFFAGSLFGILVIGCAIVAGEADQKQEQIFHEMGLSCTKTIV